MTKFAVYSDLHLEVSKAELPVIRNDVNIVILAGDICQLDDTSRLKDLVSSYKNKRFILVCGNHEYYSKHEHAMKWLEYQLVEDVEKKFENFRLLNYMSGAIPITNDITLIGDTLWTDFNKGNPVDMEIARNSVNDYKHIYTKGETTFPGKEPERFGKLLSPEIVLQKHELHSYFICKELTKNRFVNNHKTIVVTHHNPVRLQDSNFKDSNMWASFDCTDMESVIHEFKPNFWISGHTHECHDYMIGETRMLSNQRGYYRGKGTYEVKDFDPDGKIFEL